MNWIDAKKTPPRKGKWVLIWIPSLKEVKIGLLTLHYRDKYVYIIKDSTQFFKQSAISFYAEIEKPTPAKKATKKK